jgi:hypothetical protein
MALSPKYRKEQIRSVIFGGFNSSDRGRRVWQLYRARRPPGNKALAVG